MQIDRVGNSLRRAKVLTPGTQPLHFKDWIGKPDTQDYFRLRLGDRSSVSVSLNRLKGDANLQILNPQGKVIQASARRGKQTENINFSLDAGTFYIRVYSRQKTGTSYRLSLSKQPIAPIVPPASPASPAPVPPAPLPPAPLPPAPVPPPQFADLQGRFLGSSTFFSPGDALPLTFQIENIGDLAAGGFAVDFYLSTDPLVQSSDRKLGSQWIAGLAHQSGTENLTVNFALPDAADPIWQGAGTYYLGMVVDSGNQVVESNEANNANRGLSLDAQAIQINPKPSFTGFSLVDASGDSTAQTVFQTGALRFNYGLANTARLAQVRLEAVKDGTIQRLGTWTAAALSRGLVNLAQFPGLVGGNYHFRAVAQTIEGHEITSATQSMQVLAWEQIAGTVAGETLNNTTSAATGRVILGRGGTDILDLGIDRSLISRINGMALAQFTPQNSTSQQAIFRGTAFDFLTLTDGRELYFQGIEALQFSDNTQLELQVRATDPFYSQQWNLRVSDVESAWRFTQGSGNVMLVSLDTGVPLTNTADGSQVDLTANRLITDPTDHDASIGSGHGHCSISVMSATANNGEGIAGINWNSPVYVGRVYGGVPLQQVIQDAITYARTHQKRIVFQGGIEGEIWLTSGGTQADLEQLIAANADIATFAIAAGNGNLDMDDTTTNMWLGAGVARLEANHSNVMAVGALARNGITIVNGLVNAATVIRAGYSNYGSKLTLMAATDSPAMNKLGDLEYFGGTSCANPNLAGIASLVWSVNTSLKGGELRQILTDTAMDLGTAGRDPLFGHGLVNADAAVRRAWALAQNFDLAMLHNGNTLMK